MAMERPNTWTFEDHPDHGKAATICRCASIFLALCNVHHSVPHWRVHHVDGTQLLVRARELPSEGTKDPKVCTVHVPSMLLAHPVARSVGLNHDVIDLTEFQLVVVILLIHVLSTDAEVEL